MGKMSKTARASTRGKRKEEPKHYTTDGVLVERVLLVANNVRKFMWMDDAGNFFHNKQVRVRHDT